MTKKLGNPILFLLILVVIILIYTDLKPAGKVTEEIEYNEFLEFVVKDDIAVIIRTELDIIGNYKHTGSKKEDLEKNPDFRTIIPSETTFRSDMAILSAELNEELTPDMVTSLDYPFEYNPKLPPKQSIWAALLPYVMILIALGIFWYIMMQQQGGGSKVMSFGKSRARVQLGEFNKVTFNDVAGADEEKGELQEVVEFMRDPKRFNDIGARIPKGVLLVGPPGTGKTLLAKAVAGEANVPFFSISGSDFVEMFVGVGASRVRDLFNTAKKSTPAVIFIDEIDAVGRQRGAGMGGGHDEREQTLNQLLVEMDGFAPNLGIIIIAATNRPDILDPALLRPGRFDRQIMVNVPDVKGREEILKVHARNKPLGDDVNLSILAKRTPGFTGADLENVLNEGAILAARIHRKTISMTELEEAITRVVVGAEKKSRAVTEEDKKITAYHESGHAIVALKLKNCDPVHEVSIIPRGLAGGYTMTLPKEDLMHVTKSKLLDSIAMLLGGRVAESIRLGDISTGAHNDLQRATETARKMVVEFGMTDSIGPMFLGGQAEVFIAKDWGHQRNFSEEVASRIDEEIRNILETQYERAKKCIEEDLTALDRVAQALIEFERIDGDDFACIYNGEEVDLATRERVSYDVVFESAKNPSMTIREDEHILDDEQRDHIERAIDKPQWKSAYEDIDKERPERDKSEKDKGNAVDITIDDDVSGKGKTDSEPIDGGAEQDKED